MVDNPHRDQRLDERDRQTREAGAEFTKKLKSMGTKRTLDKVVDALNYVTKRSAVGLAVASFSLAAIYMHPDIKPRVDAAIDAAQNSEPENVVRPKPRPPR
jgi:hypothetical protein